jgi:hypothetical protein
MLLHQLVAQQHRLSPAALFPQTPLGFLCRQIGKKMPTGMDQYLGLVYTKRRFQQQIVLELLDLDLPQA